MADNEHREEGESQEPRILDLRHGRSGETEEAEQPEAAPEPEAPAAESGQSAPEAPQQQATSDDIGEAQTFEVIGGDNDGATVEAPAPGAEDEMPQEMPPGMDGAEAAQMEQLKQIFKLGIDGYLMSQIGMLVNFAVIHMGRAANPATGLVSAEPEKARIAIDMLELIASRVSSSLSAEERTEVDNTLRELKYLYMQQVSGGDMNGPKNPSPPQPE